MYTNGKKKANIYDFDPSTYYCFLKFRNILKRFKVAGDRFERKSYLYKAFTRQGLEI